MSRLEAIDLISSSDEETTQSPKKPSSSKDDTPDEKYLTVLQKHFGHQGFRPMQWKIINSILIHKRDVCAIMATGYGKSLCYQYPSVYTNGITIVISPLISLMEDQVLALNMANISACLLGSAQTKQLSVIDDIYKGVYRVIYATPEFCLGDYGFDVIKRVQNSHMINLLAIDEAHCVSKWGHDFRLQYRNLWKLRAVLKDVPVLAVTATATPQVQQDICSSLKLKNALNLCSGFDRPNLYFEVQLKTTGSEPYVDIKSCMTTTKQGLQFNGSTIIYCITKKRSEEVSKNLQQHGIDNVVYHAGLSQKQRKTAHENFVKDKVKVVVATIAFGMGIDKPDVRTVIHYGSAKDIESYYQEVGRAGRDGLPSKCIVFYSPGDFTIFQHLRESTCVSGDVKKRQEESELLMEKYLNISECRRKFILEYFHDNISNYNTSKRNCCDNCTRTLTQPKILNKYEGVDDNGLYNYTTDAEIFLKAVRSLGGKYGIQMYCLFLRGSKSSKLYESMQRNPLYGSGIHCSEEWWKILARILTSEGFLQKNYQKKGNRTKYGYSTVSVSDKGTMFLNDYARNKNIQLKIEPPKDLKKHLKVKQPPKENVTASSSQWIDKSAGFVPKLQTSQTENKILTTDSEDPAEKLHRTEIYKALLQIRNDIAYNMDVMPYLVASNTALMQMSRTRPKTLEEMKTHSFDGLNDGKIQKFGQQFIECIINYCSKNVLKTDTTVPPPKHDVKNVTDLKQFKFIEKPTISAKDSQNSQCSQEPENPMDDISDSDFNEIFDRIESDFDETFCETKTTEENKNEQDDSFDLLNSPKHRINDTSFDLLNSPKHQVNDTSLLDEDSIDKCLMEVAEEIENSATKKRTSNEDKKRMNNEDDFDNIWGRKKKKSHLSKCLDF